MACQRFPRTILIVEDHEDFVALLQCALSPEGYHIAAVPGGQEALTWLSSHRADLLLLDVQLQGGMSGEELIPRLKERHHRIPFIVIIPQEEAQAAVRMIKQGARDYFIRDPSLTCLLPSIVSRAFAQIQCEEHLSAIEGIFYLEQTRASAALALVTEGIFMTDAHGRITYMNRMAEELSGAPARESLGRPLEEVVRFRELDHESGHAPPLQQVLQQGLPLHSTDPFPLQHSTRTDRPVVCSGSPIQGKDGQVLGMVLVIRDMTNRSKPQEGLSRADDRNPLQPLVDHIAYDFPILLTGGPRHFSLTDSTISGHDSVDTCFPGAPQTSRRARSLTQQLPTFAKGGSAHKNPVKIGFRLMEAVTFALQGSSSRCEFGLPESLWPIHADENQIHQAIHNLVVNARQAMPAGGIITITAENTELSSDRAKRLTLAAPGPYVTIAISDQGPGIPPDLLSKIFEPYFSTKPHGNGLGLSTAYSIVKNHNGTIVAESKPGHGCTLTMFLPAHIDNTPSSPIPSCRRNGEGAILIMDDEPSIRSMVGEMVRYLGYDVQSAADGQEAIRLFVEAQQTRHPFSAVILDLTVPGKMGGAETLGQLRQLDPDVKAIVASGYSDETALSHFADLGFSGVVTKPFQLSELSQLLHRITHPKDVYFSSQSST